MRVEGKLIPVICICGGYTPTGFGATGLDLGNLKISSNSGAHIFRSDYAIGTELAPK